VAAAEKSATAFWIYAHFGRILPQLHDWPRLQIDAAGTRKTRERQSDLRK